MIDSTENIVYLGLGSLAVVSFFIMPFIISDIKNGQVVVSVLGGLIVILNIFAVIFLLFNVGFLIYWIGEGLSVEPSVFNIRGILINGGAGIVALITVVSQVQDRH